MAQLRPAPPVNPTAAEIAYAPAEPAGSQGHLLDLCVPTGATSPLPVVICTGGPILILHGASDPLVPFQQGELLHEALREACHDATFIALPHAGHGPSSAFLADDAVRADATERSTGTGCETARRPAAGRGSEERGETLTGTSRLTSIPR